MARAYLGSIGGFHITPPLSAAEATDIRSRLAEHVWEVCTTEAGTRIDPLAQGDWIDTDLIDPVIEVLNDIHRKRGGRGSVTGYASVKGYEDCGNYDIVRHPTTGRFDEVFSIEITPCGADEIATLTAKQARDIAKRVRKIAEWIENKGVRPDSGRKMTIKHGQLDTQASAIVAHFLMGE